MNPRPLIDADPAVIRALDILAPPAPPDIEHALARQHALQATTSPAQRQILSRIIPLPALPLAAALVLALSLFAPPVRSLAAQFLTIFRVQDVTPIAVDRLTQPAPDLSQLGDMTPSPRELRPRPVQVPNVGAASAQVGFTVQAPAQLPAGLSNPPSVITVTKGETLSFTFRVQKARAYLASIGHAGTPVPDKFDGATLTLHIPPAAGLAYLPPGTNLADVQQAAEQLRTGRASAAGSAQPAPNTKAVSGLLDGSSVLVLEAAGPTVEASGVPAEELRDFMLSLPGVPEQTRAQLRAIGDWHTTLPVPALPGSNLHKVTVNGAPGVAGRNGGAQMALWVRNGILYAAASPKLDERALLAVAGSIR